MTAPKTGGTPLVERSLQRRRCRGLLAAALAALTLLAAPAEAQQALGNKILGTLGLRAGSQPESGLYLADRFLL